MSDTIWLEVQGRKAGDSPQDNSIMRRLQDQLDELSEQLGVAKLRDFYDYSALEEQYGAESEDSGTETEEGQPKASWFDSAQILASVRAIHEHLTRHPKALGFKPDESRRHWPTRLMEELKHCKSVLEEAVKRGRQARLLIVP
jgi:hypothetical protein